MRVQEGDRRESMNTEIECDYCPELSPTPKMPREQQAQILDG